MISTWEDEFVKKCTAQELTNWLKGIRYQTRKKFKGLEVRQALEKKNFSWRCPYSRHEIAFMLDILP